MLKIYVLKDGRTYQFEEGEQPDGAVEYKKPAQPKDKAKKPANKARKAANK